MILLLPISFMSSKLSEIKYGMDVSQNTAWNQNKYSGNPLTRYNNNGFNSEPDMTVNIFSYKRIISL